MTGGADGSGVSVFSVDPKPWGGIVRFSFWMFSFIGVDCPISSLGGGVGGDSVVSTTRPIGASDLTWTGGGGKGGCKCGGEIGSGTLRGDGDLSYSLTPFWT